MRQVERGIRGKGPVLRLVRGDDLGHQRMGREAVAGEPDGARRHLAEAHGAEAFEGGDPGVGRRRHDRAQDAARDFAAVALLEIVARHGFRPGAEPRDGDQPILLGRIDDDRRDAREVHIFRLHHAERDAGRHSRVDRIAAGFEDAKPRLGGEIVAGGDHMAGPHDGRAMGFHGVLRGLKRGA